MFTSPDLTRTTVMTGSRSTTGYTLSRSLVTCSCSSTLSWALKAWAPMEKTCRTMFTVSGDVLVLAYSSMGPEDMGSDEEDMQDYVHSMLDHICIGYEAAVLCSITLTWTLMLCTLTKGACTIRLASGPRYSTDL